MDWPCDHCGGERCPVVHLFTAKTVSPPKPTVGRAIVRLLRAKGKANRRTDYLKSLRMYLRRFARGRIFHPLASVSDADISRHLEPFTGNSYATHLNRISSLFGYAVQQGWLDFNPCDRIERPTIDRRAPRILTPDEARTLLRACPTVCRPFLVLSLFCGIRPAEVQRLNWSDVNLAARTATINAAASKVRQRRVVTITEAAVKHLASHPIKTGPVAPSMSTVRRFKRRARAIIGGWPADILRHTALSYHLALTGDAGKVATMAGNSVKVLLTHYNGLASRKDAEQFFKV